MLSNKLFFYCSSCELTFQKNPDGVNQCPKCQDAVCNRCGLTESELQSVQDKIHQSGLCENCYTLDQQSQETDGTITVKPFIEIHLAT